MRPREADRLVFGKLDVAVGDTQVGRDNRGVRRMWLWFFIVLAGAWIGVCALAWAYQEKLIFFPSGPPTLTPRARGLEFEEQWIGVERGADASERLHGWWIPARDASVTVIVHHGNGGAIDGRLDLARVLHDLGANVLLYDYAGYGSSDGAPSVANVIADLSAVHQRALELAARSSTPIVEWGESLGGAPAAESFARYGGAGLVLESAFTSLSRIASEAYPMLPVRWLIRGELDTAGALARREGHVLIVHGEHDEIVPIHHGRDLLAAGRGHARLVEFAGGHNDKSWMTDPRALAALRDFLAACAGE